MLGDWLDDRRAANLSAQPADARTCEGCLGDGVLATNYSPTFGEPGHWELVDCDVCNGNGWVMPVTLRGSGYLMGAEGRAR